MLVKLLHAINLLFISMLIILLLMGIRVTNITKGQCSAEIMFLCKDVLHQTNLLYSSLELIRSSV